jgi:hypothetical protein
MFSKFLGWMVLRHPIRHQQGDRDPRPAPPAGRAATTHDTPVDELDRPTRDRRPRAATTDPPPPYETAEPVSSQRPENDLSTPELPRPGVIEEMK